MASLPLLLPGWGVLFVQRGGCVLATHTELLAWLATPGLAGSFHADPEKGHATLATHLFKLAVEQRAPTLSPCR